MWIPLALLASALSACSPQQQQSASHEVTKDVHDLSTNPQVQSARKNTLDTALDVRVSAAIAAEAGANAFHVAPSALNGIVTLTGTVPSHEIDRVIVQSVRGVPGVKGTVDHITIHS